MPGRRWIASPSRRRAGRQPSDWGIGMSDQEETVAALRRLHQLAQEIRAALDRDDMEVVARACSLLAPTLASRQATRDGARLPMTVEAAEIIQETQALLRESAER